MFPALSCASPIGAAQVYLGSGTPGESLASCLTSYILEGSLSHHHTTAVVHRDTAGHREHTTAAPTYNQIQIENFNTKFIPYTSWDIKCHGNDHMGGGKYHCIMVRSFDLILGATATLGRIFDLYQKGIYATLSEDKNNNNIKCHTCHIYIIFL